MNLPMEDNEAMELPVDPAAMLLPVDPAAMLLPVDPAAMLLPVDPAAMLRPEDPAAMLRPDSGICDPISRKRCVICYATAGNIKERQKLSRVSP